MNWPPTEKQNREIRRNALRSMVGEAKPKRRNFAPEASFQKTVATYLRLALPRDSGIWWSATLNGVRLSTEAARGKAKRSGLNPGLYDFIFIVRLPVPGLIVGDTYHLELKSKTGSLTKEQRELMDALWPAGRGASAKTLEQVAAALVAWQFPIRAMPS